MKGKRAYKGGGGVNEAEDDLKDKPEPRTDAKKIDAEANEMKKGGRAKRASGGKMVGKVAGEKAMQHAGRKPRKNGGRTGSDQSPFTSARHGTNPSGRSEMSESSD